MWRVIALVVLTGCTTHNLASDHQDLGGDLSVGLATDLATNLTVADLARANPVGPDLGGTDLARNDLATHAADDFAVAEDAATTDLAGVDLAPAVTTAHAIDVGQLDDGAPVKVAGLVLTGVPRVEGTTVSTNRCIYGAFAQDPSGAAPSALRLFVIADPCTPNGMGQCSCPQPPTTGTLFDATSTLGDVLTVTGTVDLFGTPTRHSVKVSTLTKIGTGGTVTPLDVTDPTPFAKDGTGYVSDENMLVTIHPAAPFTLSTLDSRGNFTGAGAQFGGIYRFYYPAPSGTFSSITGVAEIAFGGVAPRVQSDFVP